MLEFLSFDYSWLWALVVLISGILLVVSKVQENPMLSQGLSPETCASLGGKKSITFIDVRSYEEFRASTIPQARFIAFDELEQKAPKQVSKNKPVILFANTDAQAKKAVQVLKGLDFPEVHFLAGGLSAWKKAAFPIKSTQTKSPKKEQPMKKVKVYIKPTCPYCKKALALLEQKGVNPELVDIAEKPELKPEMVELSGRSTVPQIFIGDHHVGGCDDLHALERKGELDTLLA